MVFPNSAGGWFNQYNAGRAKMEWLQLLVTFPLKSALTSAR
jgi:hypothetical protein